METSNAKKHEKKLKRILIIRNLGLIFLLSLSIMFWIIGSIYYGEVSQQFSDLLFALGLGLLIASSIFYFLLRRKIKHLKMLVEKYCPKCDTPSLVLIKTTNENTGKFKNEYSSVWYSHEIIREVKYYKCSKCGHEAEITNTLASKKTFPYHDTN